MSEIYFHMLSKNELNSSLINIKNLTSLLLSTPAILLLLLACSDDDPQPGCYQDSGLDIIETINNARGTIRGPENELCAESFLIEPDEKVERRPLGSFFPCNLSEEFQVNDARVIFSGYVYEGINDGDQCADFFEITEIRPID